MMDFVKRLKLVITLSCCSLLNIAVAINLVDEQKDNYPYIQIKHEGLSDINHTIVAQVEENTPSKSVGVKERLNYLLSYKVNMSQVSDLSPLPAWFSVLKASVNYTEEPFFDPETDQTRDQSYLQLTMFEIGKNRMFGRITDSMIVGYRNYHDPYGIWWGRNLETLQYNHVNADYKWTVGVGQRLFNYSTEVSELNPNLEDIFHVLGMFSMKKSKFNIEFRTQYDHDYSGKKNNDDAEDITALRLGARLETSPKFSKIYHFVSEINTITGDTEKYLANLVDKKDIQGWQFWARHQWTLQANDTSYSRWDHKIGVHMLMSSISSKDKYGYVENPLASNTIIYKGNLTLSWLSDVFDYEQNNLLFYGMNYYTSLYERFFLGLSVSDIYQRAINNTSTIPISTNQFIGTKHLGRAVNLDASFNLYPFRFSSALIHVTTGLKLGFFESEHNVDLNTYNAKAFISMTF